MLILATISDVVNIDPLSQLIFKEIENGLCINSNRNR